MGDTDLKQNEEYEKWLIHLYDADYAWTAYERSAYLLLFVLGNNIYAQAIMDRPSGRIVFKAEIMKKDFPRLVPRSNIVYDDTHHKILDFHISPRTFEAWMDDEGIPY